jgi:tetraacyldisaccharide 4'-kinase
MFLRPHGWRRASGEPGQPTGPVLAVAGIASPALFAENAVAMGADVNELVVFPDHHDYSLSDIDRIRALAGNRAIVTTAKDQLKLTRLQTHTELWILDQSVEIETGQDVLAAALDRLAG